MSLLNVDIKAAGYERDKSIIQNIEFKLEKGELIGLNGPNGAGKSTTIKAILGMVEHKEGTVSFDRDSIYSYIPERPIFYDELTLWSILILSLLLKGSNNKNLGKEQMTCLKNTNWRIMPMSFR